MLRIKPPSSDILAHFHSYNSYSVCHAVGGPSTDSQLWSVWQKSPPAEAG